MPVWKAGRIPTVRPYARIRVRVCPPSDIASAALGFLLSRDLRSRKPMAAVGALRKWALRQFGEEFSNCRLEGQRDHSVAPTNRALKHHAARNSLNTRISGSVRERTVIAGTSSISLPISFIRIHQSCLRGWSHEAQGRPDPR